MVHYLPTNESLIVAVEAKTTGANVHKVRGVIGRYRRCRHDDVADDRELFRKREEWLRRFLLTGDTTSEDGVAS